MATITRGPKRTSLRSERVFYLSMTAGLLALVTWGFAASFYFRSWMEAPPTYIDRPGWMSWLFIAHGALFSLWLLLFATQAVLIGSKRLPLHKKVGKAVSPLFFAIIAMGLLVGYLGAKYGFHAVPFDSVTFSALPWLVIAAFAALGWAGINERRDPQRHKRLMLLAAIVISDAGIARVMLFHQFLPPWMTPTLLMLVPLVIWDLATLRRVHPTTVWGGLLAAAVLLLAVPIGSSAPWHAMVGALTGIESVPAGKIAY